MVCQFLIMMISAFLKGFLSECLWTGHLIVPQIHSVMWHTGVKLDLEGTIVNAQSFSLIASIGDIKLGGGVVLLHASLQFVAGTNL